MSILFDLILNNGLCIIVSKIGSFGKKANVKPSILAIFKDLIDYLRGSI